MNAAAFRSHLMQQFVSAARQQARTPIALIGWVQPPASAEGTTEQSERSWSSTSTRQQQQQQPLSSIASTLSSAPSSSPAPPPPPPGRVYRPGAAGMKKSMSTLASASPQDGDHPQLLPRDPDDKRATDEHERKTRTSTTRTEESTPSSFTPDDLTATAASFQTLLRTRRTTSKFRPTRTAQDDDGNATNNNNASPERLPLLLTREQYRAALHRAVMAGRAAPNHKRTEPFAFRRLLAPSASTERLAGIAEQVYLRTHRRRDDDDEDPASIVAAAQRKRDKWSQIPAFLVTLVSTKQSHEHPFPSGSATTTETENNNNDNKDPRDWYDPLPYQPPASERALEDYAAACAATQNIMLSLHSEGLASKWATGPVVQTPAFRELVQAGPDDRVVALVMIGQQAAPPLDAAVREATATTTSQMHHHRPRRYRRSLEGDVLRDL